MDSPAVVIPHLLVLYASQNDVRPPELVNVEVPEMAILDWYFHLMGQPAVKVVALLVGLWLSLPERVKESVTHLFPCPHRFVSQQTQGFPWAGLMRPYIGPALLTEVAISASVLPSIDTGIRTIGHTPAADITAGRMGVYHARPPFAGRRSRNHFRKFRLPFCVAHIHQHSDFPTA